jgi:hypothetical protein
MGKEEWRRQRGKQRLKAQLAAAQVAKEGAPRTSLTSSFQAQDREGSVTFSPGISFRANEITLGLNHKCIRYLYHHSLISGVPTFPTENPFSSLALAGLSPPPIYLPQTRLDALPLPRHFQRNYAPLLPFLPCRKSHSYGSQALRLPESWAHHASCRHVTTASLRPTSTRNSHPQRLSQAPSC